MEIRKFNPVETEEVIRIWDECGLLHHPNDPYEEIRNKVALQPDLFLVGVAGEKVIGTIMLGYEGRRGWINALCILPEYRGRGFGGRLVKYGLDILRELGAPKVNLLVRTGNTAVIEFYEKLGFRLDDAICMGYRFSEE